jgi:PAS domain S-box-containing protein
MARHEMRILSLTRMQRYGIAVLGVVFTALLRAVLESVLGADVSLFLFVFPILIAAWCGGLWPGLLATALSVLIGDYPFLPPRGAIFLLAFTGTSISILCDVTRKAVIARLERLERFGVLVDSVPDYAMFTTDPQGRVTASNAGAERITGYNDKEIRGRELSSLYASEDRMSGTHRYELDIAREAGRCELEGWQIRRDGSRFWSSGVITALRDETGQLRGFAKVVRDMTGHKQTDEVMERSQRFAQNIIDVSPTMLYIFDIVQRRRVFGNRGAAAALGYTESQLAAPEFVSTVMYSDDWKAFLEHLESLARLGAEETADIEYRIRHANGEWRWFHSRHKVFTRNTDGSVMEIIGAATDITELKNAEEKNRFMAELNHSLAPLAEPEQMLTVALRMLGEYIGVDRVTYADVEPDQNHFDVIGEYTRGAIFSVKGRYSITDFGEKEHQALREGRSYVVNDIDAESAEGINLSLYRRGNIRSKVCVPVTKDQNLVARLAIHQSTPRLWRSEEIDLITTVADRCWESIERVRVLKRLKESDDGYRAFVSTSSEGIWRYELDQPIPVTLPENEQIELFYQRGYLAECNEVFARTHGATVDQLRGQRLTVLLVRSDVEQIIELSRAFVRSGYRLINAESREVDTAGNTGYFLSNLVGVVENGKLLRAWGTQRDVSDQKRTEAALRASEDRLRRITEATQDALWEIDLKTKEVWWSEAAKALFGCSPEELQIGIWQWYDRIHPEDFNQVRTKFEDFVASDAVDWSDEYRFRRADDVYVYIHDRGRKFLNETGEPVWVGGAMVDITARKAAEADKERLAREVKQERDRLWQILEQMPIGVSIAEAPSGRVIFSNLEATRLVRHTLRFADDYKGYAKYGGLHEDGSPYRTEDYPQVRSLLSKEVIKGHEMKYRRGDGTETILSVDSAPIYDREGRMLLVVVTFIDILERKQIEKALRESEERFAKAFRTSPDALVISRIADGVIIEVNDSFVELSGYRREELIGKSAFLFNFFVDPGARRRALKILEEKGRVQDLQVEFRRKFDKVLLIQFSAELLDLHGERCWLTIGRDITERHKAEKERDQLLLTEKTAREDAEAANRLRDEFLATISHELRTPLTSILGWARMLTGRALAESQTTHALEVIQRSAESQARLVDDILDTSRIITGRFTLEIIPVEIAPIFQAAVEIIRPSAEAKRITLEAITDDRSSMVLGDASRLQQTFWNLLSNAVKFTNSGGRIEARLVRIDDRIEISITDSGIGMEPQFLPYVFDRFQQADTTSRRKYGGLGLGLAIVRHLIEAHGGHVSASSPGKGQGSSFKIDLPVAESVRLRSPESRAPEPETKQVVAGHPPDDGEKLAGVRVLVVEDDPETLDMLKFILDQSQAEVTTAASASEALRALERSPTDVLVSDLAMPDLDGYDLIREIRSRPPERGGNIPAIALSAYTRAEDRMRALAAGFQLHLPKPVAQAELIAALAKFAGHKN